MGLFDRLLGGNDATQALLSPGDRRGALQSGLLGFGVGMLRGASGTFADALASGVEGAQGGYQGAVQNAFAGQGALAHQQQMRARQDIIARFPASPHEGPMETAARLESMLPEFIRIGDMETVGKLTEYLKSVQNQKGEKPFLTAGKNPDTGRSERVLIDPATGRPTFTGVEAADADTGRGPQPHFLDVGDKTIAIDPATGKVLYSFLKGQSPASAAAGARSDLRNVFRLRDQYQRETKDDAQSAEQYIGIKASLPAALRGDPIAQKTAMLSYFKLVHPGAVVRQNEVIDLKTAGTIPDKLVRQWNALVTTGQLLPDNVIRGIAKQSEKQITARRKRYDGIRQDYRKRAESFGFDVSPDDIVGDDLFATAGAPEADRGAARVRAGLGRK